MILGLQVIALVFSIIMVYFAYVHYRRHEINKVEITAWVIVWVGAILIILFPSIFSTFARAIAITRAFDLAVIGGFVLVIPIVYMSYIKSKRLERKLEKYTREEALKPIMEKKK